MSWEYIKAEEYCDSVRDGTHDTPKPVENGYKLVTGKHIKEGRIIPDDAYFISEKDYFKICERSKVEQWDVLMSMIGNGLGRTAVVDIVPDYAIKNIALFKIGDEVKSKWLHYYISSTVGQSVIYNSLQGTGQPFISLNLLRNMQIPSPPHSTMKKIVDILSKYDDLIENNQKQIKLLEEAAQRLYKEWFVDLRFPGHENTKIVDGVPEGWRKRTVEECLSFHSNGGWGKEEPLGKYEYSGKVIRGTDINNVKSGDFSNLPLRYHTEKDVVSRSLRKNDIVFELSNGNINNIGRSLLITDYILKNCGKNTICASFCKMFRPLDLIHAIVLYLEIQDMQNSGRMLPFKKQGANGINNFAFEEFLQHELLISNDNFNLDIFINIFNDISVLQSKLTILKEARDRLLPKLMSGELEV